MNRGRAWCFTLNNYTKEDVERIQGIVCKYLILGDETGESGTPHLQGYVSFATAKRFTAVKELLGERCHIENARGSAAENRAYCSKQKVLYEAGTIPAPGKRNDLTRVKRAVETGSMRRVIEVAENYQGMRAAELMLKYVDIPRTEPPEVRWYWGNTGTGKTRTALEEAGPDTWISSKGLRWWDGYDGHKSVIIDDFRPDFCDFHTLLRYLDRYPVRVETKGGSRCLVATRIWITAPRAPDEMYHTREDCGQLMRRIHLVRSFPGTPGGTEVGGNTRAPTFEPCEEKKE